MSAISPSPLRRVQSEVSIAAMFELQAALYPKRPAIGTSAGVLHYDQLNAAANRRARALRALAAPADVPVALLMEQGSAFITAMLAVLKAGHFFVPLDPTVPPDRNAEILRDSGARWVISDAAHLERAAAIAARPCEAINLDAQAAHLRGHNLRRSPMDSDLAYLLYTSGSTGKPKAAIQDQRSVIHNMHRHVRAFAITPADRISLLYGCSVYGAMRDVFNALLNGASIHTYPVRQLGVGRLPRWLIDERITIYASVATVFRQFADAIDARDGFPDLRVIKLGGEAASSKDVDIFRKHFADRCILHCGLGSTETGMACEFPISRDTVVPGPMVPLGYPIDDLEIRLLDEHGNEVRPGEVGEITIRSRYISRGYWRRPELNERVLSCDPDNADLRIYRSGDLAVADAGGCLTHRGRKDFLVKIRGNRVETAEVEAQLQGIDSVAHAAVSARHNDAGELYLAAYVVSRDADPLPSTLRESLAQRLPSHMIPEVFVFMKELPLTLSGKVDRQSLPEPSAERPCVRTAFCAPRTAVEASLASVWGTFLRYERIGVEDDFFDLGGNSLTAVRLIDHVNAQFGQNFTLAILLRAGTIAKMAAIISGEAPHPDWSPLVALRSGGSKPPLFAVHPGGGNVLGYKDFVAFLDPEQPVYGLQAFGVNAANDPHDDIPEMARTYLRYVRSVQATGPYHLGGESFGALVAYEMACQLEESGERVGLVFLGDAWSTNVPEYRKWRFRLSWAGYVLRVTPSEWRKLFLRKILRRDPPKSVKRYVYADELHRRNSEAHRRASHRFRPRPFRGKVTLFRAGRYDHSVGRLQHYFRTPMMSWPLLAAGGVELYWIDAEHREMMHGMRAMTFARTLQACINKSN
jgi:amino acid adenylation domain-containing protein